MRVRARKVGRVELGVGDHDIHSNLKSIMNSSQINVAGGEPRSQLMIWAGQGVLKLRKICWAVKFKTMATN